MTDGRWTGRARAKINLRLRVLGREPSGYHRLETVFQALELADDVSVSRTTDPGVSIDVGGVSAGALGPAEDNLALVAARRFREAAASAGHPQAGVHVTLRKNVPHGAGLGGGSADAAAVLRGMNTLAGGLLGERELHALGADIGSDVAFFVSGSGRASGTGRGERITPLPALSPRPVLLLLPKEPVPTAWAYAALAAARETGGCLPEEPSDTPAEPVDWMSAAAHAVNDFEEVLFPLRPELRAMRDALARVGAQIAMLSGSGSAVFGLFHSDAEMATAAEALGAVATPAWVRTIRTVTAD